MACRNLWQELCSIDNLFLAYTRARKHKTLKSYVVLFEKNLNKNLLQLQWELLTFTYRPKPLETFTIRDPKTRKISKSDFRDRIIHHALCNIIEPIFEKAFIHDSYANRITKGTLNAVERFEYFKRKVSKNNQKDCYILKADIRQYFETVNHEILIRIIEKKIRDKNILWLIKIILSNHKTSVTGRGMPLGNLTSQFFANVYLDTLDQYIKKKLHAKYYIRYVDDFVLLSDSEKELIEQREKINTFLIEKLALKLHPEKTKIIMLRQGVGFLGLRIFENYRILKKSNIRKFKNKLSKLGEQYDNKEIDYDKIYDAVEGWIAYTKTADIYNSRIKILKPIGDKFNNEISTKEYNRHLKDEKKRKFLVSQNAENKDNI